MFVLEGHTAPVYALAFSRDGRLLASGAKDCTVRLWDEAGIGTEIVAANREVPVPVNALAWDETGTQLAVATGSAVVILTECPTRPTPTWVTRPGATSAHFVRPDLLAIGFGDRARPDPGQFELWDLKTKQRREPTFRAMYGVRSAALHEATRRVAWGEWGGRLHVGPRLFVWDIAKPDPIRFSLPHKATSLVFHPDGEQLAAAIEWEVRTFDLNRRQEKARLRGHKGVVSCVAASPDGRQIASGSWDGTVRLWDWTTGQELSCFQWGIGKVFALAYASDGLRMVAAGEKGTIMMWDTD